MIEIPPLDMLDRDAEAQLIYELWYSLTLYESRFHELDDNFGHGSTTVHTSIWESDAYPNVGIALVSVDTHRLSAGRYTYIDDTWKGEIERYRLSFDGSKDYKVIRRYLISSDYTEEEKHRRMFAAADRRFLADIIDSDAGLCRIAFCD